MTMLYDRATISGKARITPEGYFVADALVAQAGNVQSYYARELGMTDRDPNSIVRVYRPEAEVFAVDSLKSASRLPITLDHPAAMVDAKNFREYAKGETGEEVLRDGQFLRVPLRVTHADAVDSVQTDRQEFSLGYTSDLKFAAGVSDAGEAYDATATNIRYNHLAACRTARGGPQLRIVDERPAPKGVRKMPFLLIDGVPVDTSNAEIADTALRNLLAARETATAGVADAMREVSARDVTIAARDAEIVGLKDQLAAAKPTPQALRDMVASFARVVDQAKRMGATVTDAMDEHAVRVAAVSAKLGDVKAQAYTADQVVAAFDMLAASLGDAPGTPLVDSLALVAGTATTMGDAATAAATAKQKRLDRFASAHKSTAAA